MEIFCHKWNYDSVMKQVTEMPAELIKYLSPKIQNELIECLGQKLINTLIKNINLASFYSLMLDTTQDISKKDQLSVVIKHVQLCRNEVQQPTNYEIFETFLGFYDLHDHSL